MTNQKYYWLAQSTPVPAKTDIKIIGPFFTKPESIAYASRQDKSVLANTTLIPFESLTQDRNEVKRLATEVLAQNSIGLNTQLPSGLGGGGGGGSREIFSGLSPEVHSSISEFGGIDIDTGDLGVGDNESLITLAGEFNSVAEDNEQSLRNQFEQEIEDAQQDIYGEDDGIKHNEQTPPSVVRRITPSRTYDNTTTVPLDVAQRSSD